jgi:hypothetical protein
MGVPRPESSPLSRRTLLKTAAIGAGLPLLRHVEDMIPPNVPIVDVEKGYEQIRSAEDPFYKALTEPQKVISVPFITKNARHPNVITQLEFKNQGQQLMTLDVMHKPSKEVESKVMVAAIGNMYLFLPIMQGPRLTHNKILIPLDENTQEEPFITLIRPNSSPSTHMSEIEKITLSTQEGNELQNAFIESTPMYAIQRENMATLRRDMPWLSCITSLTKDKNLRTAHTLWFDSETGGMTDEARLKEYSLPDLQLVYQADIKNALAEPHVSNQLIQQRAIDIWKFKGGWHTWGEFTGNYFRSHPQIQIKDDNNTVSSRLETGLFYFPLPHFPDPRINQRHLLTLNPEILLTSLQESAKRRSLPQNKVNKLREEYIELLNRAPGESFPHI